MTTARMQVDRKLQDYKTESEARHNAEVTRLIEKHIKEMASTEQYYKQII